MAELDIVANFFQCQWVDFWSWGHDVCIDVAGSSPAAQATFIVSVFLVAVGMAAVCLWRPVRFLISRGQPTIVVHPPPAPSTTLGQAVDFVREADESDLRILLDSLRSRSDFSEDALKPLAEVILRTEKTAARQDDKRALEAVGEAKEGDITDLRTLLKERYAKLAAELGSLAVEKARAARDLAAVEYPLSVKRAVALYREAAELDPGDFWGWINYGQALTALGPLGPAEAAFRSAFEVAERQDDNRHRAVALSGIADIERHSKHLGVALKGYRAAHGFLEQRARALPHDLDRQRDLSVSHNKIGDVLVAEGKLEEARKAYEAGLGIAKRLAKADPKNSEWQRDLSVSHNRIGDVLVAEGKLAEARKAHEAGLGIRERLAEADPRNSAWQRDLSVSHNKIGDVLRAEGKLEEARKAYEAGLGIAKRLAKADPKNSAWQRDLSVSHDKIGDVLVAEGKRAEARKAYERGLGIAKRLAEADPKNSEWQRDLSVCHNKIGDVLVAEGKLAEARKAYEAGLGIAKRLAEADPKNSEWQADLAVSHGKLGLLGSTDAAGHFKTALNILRPLAADNRLPAHQMGWIEMTERLLAEAEARKGGKPAAKAAKITKRRAKSTGGNKKPAKPRRKKA